MKQTHQRDERATAYALNELQGPEKDQFEKELDSVKGLILEVDSIRDFCKNLSRELQREALPEQDARLTKNLLNTAEGLGDKSGRKINRFLVWGIPSLLAAGIAAVHFFLNGVNEHKAAHSSGSSPSEWNKRREMRN